MMTLRKCLLIAGFTLLGVLSHSVLAAGGSAIELDQANNDLRNQASLQRGAVLFATHCMTCHSVKYMRFNRIAKDIGWTNEDVVQKMSFGLGKPVDTLTARMADGVAKDVLGAQPTDLSLMARLKGTDYIYTFLNQYYQDESGEWNNRILKGTAMPNVLEGLKRHSKPEEHQQAVRDIVNFMEYIGEPAKLQRWDLGWKVILFLFVLLLLTYLLKKEYWRDVK